MTTFSIQLSASASPEVLGTRIGDLFQPLGSVSPVTLAVAGASKLPTVLVEYLGGPTGASMWMLAGGTQLLLPPGGSWSCGLGSEPLVVDVGIGTSSARITFQHDASREVVMAYIEDLGTTTAAEGPATELLKKVRTGDAPTVDGGAGGGHGDDYLVAMEALFEAISLLAKARQPLPARVTKVLEQRAHAGDARAKQLRELALVEAPLTSDEALVDASVRATGQGPSIASRARRPR